MYYIIISPHTKRSLIIFYLCLLRIQLQSKKRAPAVIMVMRTLTFLFLLSIVPKDELQYSQGFKQLEETSCGYSVVSSLLFYYYNIDITETELLSNYFSQKTAVGDYTLSFLEIRTILTDYGIESRAYKMTFEELEKHISRFAPIIIHYDRPENHFSLLLKKKDGFIITSDPAQGLRLSSIRDFKKMWSGNVILTASKTKTNTNNIIDTVTEKAHRRITLLDEFSRFPPLF
jgi:uncharacterized protein